MNVPAQEAPAMSETNDPRSADAPQRTDAARDRDEVDERPRRRRRRRWHDDGDSFEDRGAFNPRYKSPALASFLSLAPGLGQIYVGYYVQGFVHAAVVALTITLLTSGDLGDVAPFFGLFLPFFILYNIIDAGRRAALFNLAMQGDEQAPLPGKLPTARFGGTAIFGVLLLVIGLIAFSNTALGIELDWLEVYWPLLPIGLGAYLLLRSLVDRLKAAD